MTTEQKTEAEKDEATKASPQAPIPFMMGPSVEFERWFDEFFPNYWLAPMRRVWRDLGDVMTTPPERCPNVDLIDRDEDILVKAELPGVSRKDLDISISGRTLRLTAKVDRDETKQQGHFQRHEITHSQYIRSLYLPDDVDAEKAKAALKNGMLELTLPKITPTNQRSIQVQ